MSESTLPAVLTSQGCALLSRAQNEPLAGTAAEASAILAVEENGQWAPKTANTAGIQKILGTLKRWAKPRNARLQLIRRPGARVQPTRRLIYSELGADGFTVEMNIADADFASFDFNAALCGPRTTETLELVCAHGKRDRCCAIEGLAYYHALSNRSHVWLTSHLGGHRFAATTVMLPSGLCYGRLTPEHVLERPLSCLRGRMSYARPVQLAEIYVMELGHRHCVLQQVSQNDDHASVQFSAAGQMYDVRMSLGPARPCVKTCGEEAKPVRGWTVLGHTSARVSEFNEERATQRAEEI